MLIWILLHIELYNFAGVMHMAAFDIHENPLPFLQFLAGLSNDPTIEVLPDGFMTVTINNTYTVKETVLQCNDMRKGHHILVC